MSREHAAASRGPAQRRRAWLTGVAASVAAVLLTAGTALAATSGSSGRTTPSGSNSPRGAASTHAAPKSAKSDDPRQADPSDAQETESDDHGSDGGSIARDHSASCNLAGPLTGNWTHGDYVSAVAARNPANVRAAAQSSCGKPLKAHGRGNGAANRSSRANGANGTHGPANGAVTAPPNSTPSPAHPR